MGRIKVCLNSFLKSLVHFSIVILFWLAIVHVSLPHWTILPTHKNLSYFTRSWILLLKVHWTSKFLQKKREVHIKMLGRGTQVVWYRRGSSFGNLLYIFNNYSCFSCTVTIMRSYKILLWKVVLYVLTIVLCSRDGSFLFWQFSHLSISSNSSWNCSNSFTLWVLNCECRYTWRRERIKTALHYNSYHYIKINT